jgi:hypothetical protein
VILRLLREGRLILDDNHWSPAVDLASPGRALRGVDISGLVVCLRALGIDISEVTYRSLEAGGYLPNDAPRFLDAWRRCLRPTQHELHVVVWQWAFDLLRRECSESFAWEVLKESVPNRR